MTKQKHVREHVWYIKWASEITIIITMVFHVLGITPWNSILQLNGASGWIYFEFKLNEKAFITNFMPQFFIIIPGLLYFYFK